MAETGVKENPTGNMADEEEQAKATSEKKAKTPAKASKVSPEPEERIYTQAQADDLVQAGRSDAGRKAKEWEDKFTASEKSVTTLNTKLDGIQDERNRLQTDLEDMSSDDPKKFDLIKRDRELRQRENDTRDKIAVFEEQEQGLSAREQKVSSFELDILVETVADEYEDGDSKRLKNAVSKFDKPNEEQVRHLAGIIFSDKTNPEEVPKTPKRYSGKSDGGGSAIYTRAQIADRAFWKEHKEDIQKASREPGQPRIKD